MCACNSNESWDSHFVVFVAHRTQTVCPVHGFWGPVNTFWGPNNLYFGAPLIHFGAPILYFGAPLMYFGAPLIIAGILLLHRVNGAAHTSVVCYTQNKNRLSPCEENVTRVLHRVNGTAHTSVVCYTQNTNRLSLSVKKM